MKRLLLALMLLPATALAQGFPVPASNAPMFGFPFAQGSTANPFVNISFTGQALGQDNCTTAPPYGFTSAPTNGWGGTATSICGVVAGVATLTGTATGWTSTVPYVGTTADFSGNVAIGNYVGTDTDTTAGIMVNSVWRWRVTTSVEVPAYALLPNGAFSIGDGDGNSPTNIWAETGVNVEIDGIGGGFFGGTTNDVQWYRSAANTWRTPDAVVIDTSIALATAFAINTAPTVSNGCTAEAMTWNNGTAAFEADMGNTCAGVSTVVFTLPTITNKYGCKATNLTSPATIYMDPTAWSTTTVTFTNFSRTTGLATAFTDGDDVMVSCLGG